MPEGYIRFIGSTRRTLARRVAELRQARIDANIVSVDNKISTSVQPPVWQPGMPFPDATPRPVRQQVFGAGDQPLPGASWSEVQVVRPSADPCARRRGVR